MFLCDPSYPWQASHGARRALQVGFQRQDRKWLLYLWPSPTVPWLMSGSNHEPRKVSKHLGSASCQGRATLWPLLGKTVLEGCVSASLTSSGWGISPPPPHPQPLHTSAVRTREGRGLLSRATLSSGTGSPSASVTCLNGEYHSKISP